MMMKKVYLGMALTMAATTTVYAKEESPRATAAKVFTAYNAAFIEAGRSLVQEKNSGQKVSSKSKDAAEKNLRTAESAVVDLKRQIQEAQETQAKHEAARDKIAGEVEVAKKAISGDIETLKQMQARADGLSDPAAKARLTSEIAAFRAKLEKDEIDQEKRIVEAEKLRKDCEAFKNKLQADEAQNAEKLAAAQVAYDQAKTAYSAAMDEADLAKKGESAELMERIRANIEKNVDPLLDQMKDVGYDSALLLTDLDTKINGYQISTMQIDMLQDRIFSRVDNTMLGRYVKQAINGNKNFCATVAACSGKSAEKGAAVDFTPPEETMTLVEDPAVKPAEGRTPQGKAGTVKAKH